MPAAEIRIASAAGRRTLDDVRKTLAVLDGVVRNRR
jgi:hypothetical protein